MNFNQRLKDIRQSKKLTQKEVADAVSISITYYQELEYGKKEPTLSKLTSLADYFDVSIDYLAGRSTNPNIHRY